MRKIYSFIVLLLVMTLAACRSSKQTAQTPVHQEKKQNLNGLVQTVQQHHQGLNVLTAKLNLDIQAGGKDISVGGSLKMRRNDVIQLAVSAFFMEVGRIEFTPEYMLVLDRMGKRYVKASYTEVPYLQKAGLSFYTLQALFWNELFAPGKTRVLLASDFSASQQNNHVTFSPKDQKMLAIRFLTDVAGGLLKQTKVNGTGMAQKVGVQWDYQDFQKINKSIFPKRMHIQVTGTGKDIQATLSLNNIREQNNWGRTAVSAKYHKVNAEEMFKILLNL